MNKYVKTSIFLLSLALLSACGGEQPSGSATFPAEFAAFHDRFPDLNLPLTIDEEFEKSDAELASIPDEELVRFVGAKRLDPESDDVMLNMAGAAVGKFMLNDSITALLYRALELPVGSGDFIYYTLLTVDATGLERGRQVVAAFNGWDGGYHGQSCTIAADGSISALSETSYTNNEGEDVVSKRVKYDIGIRPDGSFDERKEVLFTEKQMEAASPFTVTEITRNDLSDVIKKGYSGKLVKAVTWQDTLGKNYLVFSTKEIATPGGEEDAVDYYLYGKHFVETGEKFPKVLWSTQDFEKACMFDSMLDLMGESISVTDLDGDRVAETAYMYTTGCVSDVSPYPLKLIMHEGDKKMAVRGMVRLAYFEENPDEEVGGAEYTVDEATFDGQPKPFRDFAIQHWGRHDLVK